jgi:hypothetical protein
MADNLIKEVPEFRVKFNDVFHLKNLYIMMHEYLVDESWTGETGTTEQPSNTHRDIEKLYMEINIKMVFIITLRF